MPVITNVPLVIGAALSAIAAILHVCIIFGGPRWYRFFGAGKRMVAMAAEGRSYPTVFTAGITTVLAIWSAYALSGAGVIEPLPLLKVALPLITGVYLLRGLVVVPLLTFARTKSTPFLIWSSVVCLGYGIIHLVGVMQVWSRL
jgi:hypothetical protein